MKNNKLKEYIYFIALSVLLTVLIIAMGKSYELFYDNDESTKTVNKKTLAKDVQVIKYDDNEISFYDKQLKTIYNYKLNPKYNEYILENSVKLDAEQLNKLKIKNLSLTE